MTSAGVARRLAAGALGGALLLGPAARPRAATPIAPPDLTSAEIWIPTGGGTVRVLDKQKASSEVLTLKVGQTIDFETLSVRLDGCEVHAPDVPADNAGRLVVTDRRQGEPGFEGWMFSNEPWVAMLQSPVYGVRVIGCEKPSAEAIAAVRPAPVAPPPPPPAVSPDAGSAGGSPPAGDLEAPPGQPLGTGHDDSDPPPPASPSPQSSPPSVPPSGGDR